MRSLAKLLGSCINFSCDTRSALTTLLNPHGKEEEKSQDYVLHCYLHMDCGYKRSATVDRKWVNWQMKFSRRLFNATVLIYPQVYRINLEWKTNHLNSGVV
jgi:hypothetical protein